LCGDVNLAHKSVTGYNLTPYKTCYKTISNKLQRTNLNFAFQVTWRTKVLYNQAASLNRLICSGVKIPCSSVISLFSVSDPLAFSSEQITGLPKIKGNSNLASRLKKKS
jgi:hypothetical protein